MKTVLILIIFISSLSANDPTVIKGKLKEALKKRDIVVVKEKKALPIGGKKALPAKSLQEDIDQLVFKALYKKSSTRRLMLGNENKLILLEVNNHFELKGETYRLINFNEDKAQLIHIRTKEILTFIYRP